jgi:hypothetical protein
MVMVFWLAWQQTLNTLRYNLKYKAGDLYCWPLIPDLLLDYARKLCPSVEPEERPYCLYFTYKDGGRLPVMILLTDQKLHYFNPYRPDTVAWGAIREIGSIPLGAIGQFEIETRPFRTLLTVNEQEFLTLPYRLEPIISRRLRTAVELKRGRETVRTNIRDTYLDPENSIDGYNLADVTHHFLNQFVPLFNFYASPFRDEQLQELQAICGCRLQDEIPLIHLPLNSGSNHCGVLITTENMYVIRDRVQAIPLSGIYQAGLATVNNLVYLHINGECQGILYEEHNAFDERNTRVLQTLLRLYRRTLNRCKPVPTNTALSAYYRHPDHKH